MNQHFICAIRICLLGLITASSGYVGLSQSNVQWLSLCGQCVSPRIFSKSGLGTAHAVAEAKITLQDAKDNCLNFSSPDNEASCTKQACETVKEEAGKVYRASADCVSRKITAIDGKNYTLAGAWAKKDDIGFGRSRWRDAAGKVVGTSETDGGLAISQQWEVLCPTANKTRSAVSPTSNPALPALERPATAHSENPAANPCGRVPRCYSAGPFTRSLRNSAQEVPGGRKRSHLTLSGFRIARSVVALDQP